MNKLVLVCNAHIDPVWQWDWDEGAAATIATFRVAADFCEQYEGFAFCHNEALLYQWVEEYDPQLFERIQKLVSEGKWHIMGGWYLQPDCNIPSGESVLRQILAGRRYFSEKFNSMPRTAVNFDSFGHSQGLVQILSQCGFDSYVFMRPEPERMDLPARTFVWKGQDGSTVVARRLDMAYSSELGQTAQKLDDWVAHNGDEEVSLFPWGVGNHGGGPSRADWENVQQWIAERPDVQCIHGTLEDFFEETKRVQKNFPEVDRDLRTVFVGCYTSQAKLKQMHRRLESEIFATEKLMANVCTQGLCEYPTEKFEEAQRILMLCQFHDTLPGTTIEDAERSAMGMLQHGLHIMSQLRMKGIMALTSRERKAAEGEIPFFAYNPHPYEVTGEFASEYMPANQNRSTSFMRVSVVRQNGEVIPSQEEKEGSNINMDWRKRVVFRGTLAPSALTRFDCVQEIVPHGICEYSKPISGTFTFETDEMIVQINANTGLIDAYRVNGIDYLKPGAFATVLHEDNPDPWHMDSDCYGARCGHFRLMTPEETAHFLCVPEKEVAPVRIIEDGAVRVVVESMFICGNSTLVQTYRLPKFGSRIEVEQRIFWSEADKIAKLEIPTYIPGVYWGQGMFGATRLPQDGTETVSQGWCGLFDRDRAITVLNDGVHGSHCEGDTVYLSLMRSACYCAHPVDDRQLISHQRFIPRMDQGVHTFKFAIQGGNAEERRCAVDSEAQMFQEKPYVLNVFPGGNGTEQKSLIRIPDTSVLLVAAYMDAKTGKNVIRLWNSANERKELRVELPAWDAEADIVMDPYRFQTYCVSENGLILVDPVTLEKLR